ncbi:hypothetical protein AB0C07_12905 [Actinoplanes missouriensis]|uniref:hypothetical protein n=1 Tax=Actinoplanes missouriensis TaxID=1866 RepID=UPI00340B8AA8
MPVNTFRASYECRLLTGAAAKRLQGAAYVRLGHLPALTEEGWLPWHDRVDAARVRWFGVHDESGGLVAVARKITVDGSGLTSLPTIALMGTSPAEGAGASRSTEVMGAARPAAIGAAAPVGLAGASGLVTQRGDLRPVGLAGASGLVEQRGDPRPAGTMGALPPEVLRGPVAEVSGVAKAPHAPLAATMHAYRAIYQDSRNRRERAWIMSVIPELRTTLHRVAQGGITIGPRPLRMADLHPEVRPDVLTYPAWGLVHGFTARIRAAADAHPDPARRNFLHESADFLDNRNDNRNADRNAG